MTPWIFWIFFKKSGISRHKRTKWIIRLSSYLNRSAMMTSVVDPWPLKAVQMTYTVCIPSLARRPIRAMLTIRMRRKRVLHSPEFDGFVNGQTDFFQEQSILNLQNEEENSSNFQSFSSDSWTNLMDFSRVFYAVSGTMWTDSVVS